MKMRTSRPKPSPAILAENDPALQMQAYRGVWVYDHANAVEILKTLGNGRAFDEILEVFSRLPLLRFNDKSEKNPDLVYLQTCINKTLDYVLNRKYGWSRQVTAPGGFLRHKLDFHKRFGLLQISLEVETGNTSRGDSDINKHLHAVVLNLADVAITVVAMPEVAGKMDSSVAHLPRLVKVLASSQAHKSIPHLVIGIPDCPHRVLGIEDWNYTLSQLKGSKDTPEKDAVAKRVWEEFILPTLPANSCYHEYQAEVARTDIDRGNFTPSFSECRAQEPETPVIKLYDADGQVTQEEELHVKFVEPPKRKSRCKKRPIQQRKAAARKASKSKAAHPNRPWQQYILQIVRPIRVRSPSTPQVSSRGELKLKLVHADAATDGILAKGQEDGTLDAAAVAKLACLASYRSRLVAALLASH